MRALLYTSDPYEPSGVIGLYETEEQKQKIITGYKKYLSETFSENEKWIQNEIDNLKEIEIPLGVCGQYY